MDRGRNRWIEAILLGGVLVALIGIAGYGPPIMAQEQPPAEEATEPPADKTFEEEIVVTGTLIPRPTLEALSPVATMGIEEITYSGVTRMEDLMTTLPQVFSSQNSTVANGASGTATIDLRYLGSDRTLVLLDGRRMAPGDPYSYAPDLNFVPAALVKRVDILTGGASAVYGTDAVAGVVNFILDKDFEGFRGGVQYSFYQHDNDNALAQQINADAGFTAPDGNVTDGDGISANVAYGSKFADGKGHASLFLAYRNLDEVTKRSRDYLHCSVGAFDDGPGCYGSSTSSRGRFIAYDANDNFIGDFEVGGNGHEFVDFDTIFNYAPYNHIQRPDERWNGGAFINYQFNEHVEGYADITFMNDYTDAQIAPSGAFNGDVVQLNCDNPMMSDQQRELLCGPGTGYGPTDYATVYALRRNVEGAGRSNALRHTTFRLSTGIRGDINDQWSYDLYGLIAQNNQNEAYYNDLNVTRINNALDVIGDPDDPSTWQCRNGGGDGCVPWNIFQQGGVTQAALDYITTVLVRYGTTKTEVLNGTLRGDLEDYGWKFGSATEGIQIAVGAEYRTEFLEAVPDDNYATGNGAGQGGAQPPIEGSLSVAEGIFEALVPIIQDAPGARDLSMELGYRYSDYSTSGGTSTWKAQLAWAPTSSFKFRTGLNRAIRSANIGELYLPVGTNLNGSIDPCAGAVPTATLEECMRTGVTAEQYGTILENPAGQYNNLQGGNVNLEPETADTMTFGVVVTPEALPGFNFTVDYYDIEISEAIDQLDADDIVTTCLATGDPGLCALVHRDARGTLWLLEDGYTITTYQNIGTTYGEGIDTTIGYMFGLGDAGFLSTDLIGSYTLSNRLANPIVDYECVGYFGFQCGQPVPEWSHRARVQWDTTFNTSLSLVWRYIGSTDNDDYSPEEELRNEGNWAVWEANDVASVDAYNYFDLAGTYTFKGGIQFTVGINNILDEEPPFWPDHADDTTISTYSTYDPLGRYIFTSLRFDF